jgi:hypothetical protein
MTSEKLGSRWDFLVPLRRDVTHNHVRREGQVRIWFGLTRCDLISGGGWRHHTIPIHAGKWHRFSFDF